MHDMFHRATFKNYTKWKWIHQKTNSPVYVKTILIIFFFVLYRERDIGQNVTQARLKSSFREIFCFIQANPRSSCGFVWLRPGETRALQ